MGNQTVSEQIKPGMKVLFILDHHGLGDQVMFRPLYLKMKELYPDVTFNFKAGYGQEYFDEINCPDYDATFNLGFYENDMRQVPQCLLMSKPEVCCVKELGIPFQKELEFTWKPDFIPNNINIKPNTVAVIPFCHSAPSRSLTESAMNFVWDTVKEFGFNPLEVHFEPAHYHKTPRYSFVDYTCRSFKPSIPAVYDVLSKCKAAIGVNTGTFCVSVSLGLPVLHMTNTRRFYPHFKRFDPIPETVFASYGFIKEDIINFFERLTNE